MYCWRRSTCGSRLGSPRPRGGFRDLGRKFRGVREGVRCRGRRSAAGLAAVSGLTNLSAGGLRSSATVGAAHRTQGACARRMGADPRHGLAAAKWQHARKNCRRPRTSVLGPEACRVFGTEESYKPNSAAAETGLLYSKRVLLGRSDSVSGGRALERCSGFCVLEWSSCEDDSRARWQATRIAMRVARN